MDVKDKASFTSLYTVGKLLGEGGCGSVYAGTRKADGKQVAIKYVTSSFSKRHLTIPGESQSLPLEVALMELVCRPPACSHVIQLLDWFEEPEYVILVLELPSPCLDVSTFTKQLGGYMEESLAQVIMQQVVQAALHCRERGVLHRDIKSKNLLIQTDDFHVKLIDFGCGDLLKEDPYRQFAGTRPFRPPEWVRDGEYHGRPATIWSLGVLLYVLVCGAHPFRREEDIIAADLQFKPGLSTDCRNLIRWCLQKDPSKRPALEQILQHDWMRS
ncbi:serine/threonine-protein kinase pim-3-like [Megalops cyprinoides]|uniref:serine/threonine-protein kinase pim-3-like n=1 Tax=Megalops cyprinoides TaxID=118141 RepID=UPI00186414A4|nr:serine/threonine-protein kinase pim-3-like [Megalops cyprinoides]